MIETCVTGSSGFIGSHLMKRLPEAQALGHTAMTFRKCINPDKVFFLSTYGNMAHHSDHGKIVKANVCDLMDMLRGFTNWICYMSSSSVTLPVQTPYSRTKRAAEEILQALPELKSCIVRCYSVTGVGEQKEHLIPTLIRSCMEGEEMPFVPYHVHDFIDVEDIVDGLIRLGNENVTGMHEFGSGNAYPNASIAMMVEEICGKKANTKHVESMRAYDNDDWYCRNPSPFFKSTKTLRQSIQEMVDAYKDK